MAYATAASFVDVVTAAEATVLAKAAPPATGYDADKIDRELADASAEIDTYLAARYPTPLTPVPRVIERAAISLAREAMDRQGRDQVVKEAARVRAWLKDVSRGVATLAGNEADQEAPEPAAAGGVQFVSPERVFTDQRLARFTGGGQ